MNNSKGLSTILTLASSVGAITAVIFTAKGTKEAIETLRSNGHLEDALTKENLVRTISEVWQHYIPAAAALGASIGCGVGSHCVSVQAQMATAGAAAALGSQLKNLDRGAKEFLGKEKYSKLRNSIAAKTMDPKKALTQKIKEPDKDCYYEPITKQYFSATNEDILKIECDLNKAFQQKSFVTFAEYLSFFPEDMVITPADHEYGWYMDESFDMNSKYQTGDGYYISLYCHSVDIDGDHVAIEVSPEVLPCDPTDEWILPSEEKYWNSELINWDEAKEINGKEAEVA